MHATITSNAMTVVTAQIAQHVSSATSNDCIVDNI